MKMALSDDEAGESDPMHGTPLGLDSPKASTRSKSSLMQGDCHSRDMRPALSRNLFASDWAVAKFWVILPRAEQLGNPAASRMPDMPMIATAIVVLRPNLSIALVDRVISPT